MHINSFSLSPEISTSLLPRLDDITHLLPPASAQVELPTPGITTSQPNPSHPVILSPSTPTNRKIHPRIASIGQIIKPWLVLPRSVSVHHDHNPLTPSNMGLPFFLGYSLLLHRGSLNAGPGFLSQRSHAELSTRVKLKPIPLSDDSSQPTRSFQSSCSTRLLSELRIDPRIPQDERQVGISTILLPFEGKSLL